MSTECSTTIKLPALHPVKWIQVDIDRPSRKGKGGARSLWIIQCRSHCAGLVSCFPFEGQHDMAEPTQKFQDACEWLAGINCPVVTDGGLSHEDGRHRLPGRYSIQPTLCNGYMSADLHRRQNRATSFIFFWNKNIATCWKRIGCMYTRTITLDLCV